MLGMNNLVFSRSNIVSFCVLCSHFSAVYRKQIPNGVFGRIITQLMCCAKQAREVNPSRHKRYQMKIQRIPLKMLEIAFLVRGVEIVAGEEFPLIQREMQFYTSEFGIQRDTRVVKVNGSTIKIKGKSPTRDE